MGDMMVLVFGFALLVSVAFSMPAGQPVVGRALCTAFQARYDAFDQGMERKRSGRFMRDANCSTRTEWKHVPAGAVIVRIRNFGDKKAWTRDENGDWFGAELPPGATGSVRQLADFARPSVSVEPATFEDMKAYKLTHKLEGSVQTVVERLEFFTVEYHRRDRVDLYSGILIGPQAVESFRPDPGLQVRYVSLRELGRIGG